MTIIMRGDKCRWNGDGDGVDAVCLARDSDQEKWSYNQL